MSGWFGEWLVRKVEQVNSHRVTLAIGNGACRLDATADPPLPEEYPPGCPTNCAVQMIPQNLFLLSLALQIPALLPEAMIPVGSILADLSP